MNAWKSKKINGFCIHVIQYECCLFNNTPQHSLTMHVHMFHVIVMFYHSSPRLRVMSLLSCPVEVRVTTIVLTSLVRRDLFISKLDTDKATV